MSGVPQGSLTDPPNVQAFTNYFMRDKMYIWRLYSIPVIYFIFIFMQSYSTKSFSSKKETTFQADRSQQSILYLIWTKI